MVLLIQVPSYALRMEAMILKEEFTPACFTLHKEMDTMQAATKELMACEELHAVLHLVLQAGNIMNAGGYAGNAVGFKLSSLLKLADTKANKPGMNLLHFVVLEAQKKDATLSTFPEKLKHVQAAARLSGDSVNADLHSLDSRTNSMQIHLKQDVELFHQMEDFIQQGLREVARLEAQRMELQREANTLIDFFCEDKETMKLEECFKIFQDFCDRFKKAVKENRDREIKELCQQQRLKELEEKRHSWAAGERSIFGRSSSENDVKLLIKDGLHDLIAFTHPRSQSPGSVKRTRSRRLRSSEGSAIDSHLLSFLQAAHTEEQAKSNSIPRSVARSSRQRVAWQKMSETHDGSLDSAHFDSNQGCAHTTVIKDSYLCLASAEPCTARNTETAPTENFTKTESAIGQHEQDAYNNNENRIQDNAHTKYTDITNLNQMIASEQQLELLEGLQIFNYASAADSSQVTTCDDVTLTDLEYSEDLSLQTPTTDVSLSTPSTDVSVQTPSTDVGMQTPSTDVGVQTPSTDVSVQTPSTDVSVQTPSTDVSVQTPSTEENLQTTDTDVSVQACDTDMSPLMFSTSVGIQTSSSSDSGVFSGLVSKIFDGESYCFTDSRSLPQKIKNTEGTEVSIQSSDAANNSVLNKESRTVFFVLGYTGGGDCSEPSEQCEVKAACQKIQVESQHQFKGPKGDHTEVSNDLSDMKRDNALIPITKNITINNDHAIEAASETMNLPKVAKQICSLKQPSTVRGEALPTPKSTLHCLSSPVPPKTSRTTNHPNNEEMRRVLPISKSSRRSNSVRRPEAKALSNDEQKHSQKASGSKWRDTWSKTPRRSSYPVAEQKPTKETAALANTSNSIAKRKDSLRKPAAKPVRNIPKPRPDESSKICRSVTRSFPRHSTNTGGTTESTEGNSNSASPMLTPNFARNTVASSSRRQRSDPRPIPSTPPQPAKATNLTRTSSQRQTMPKHVGTNHTKSSENTSMKRPSTQKLGSKTEEEDKAPTCKTQSTYTGDNTSQKSTEKNHLPATDSIRSKKTPERSSKWK
ncbi:FH2 domain-containing protein 1 isoform X2 [Amblyraja radiata]|nr:FH2 domain-containing protein 1 isoform X2 [Amblyraja radiata]